MDKRELSEETADSDPILQFDKWFGERMQSGVLLPEAVNLGTAALSGRVSVRTVLLKQFDNRGFVFYTNFDSRKGKDLQENGFAALHFHWPEAGRQIRIEGKTEKLSEAESEAYFQTRPRESQIGAWVSPQSTVIPDRRFLEKNFSKFKSEFDGKPVSKPPYWGGFRLRPDYFEFWSDGNFRLHDRITYQYDNSLWIMKRIAP
jgi:pyridoxamine 5'-phosphate oxidase